MNESSDDSALRSLHRLAEHYTPDGTLGRLLFGGVALFLAPILFFGGSSILLGGTNFLPVALSGLASVVLSVPALLAGLVALWPVYLSLIGNVETPAAYPDGATAPRTTRESAEDVLKRRYAAGELSREEFERRLDDVLGRTHDERASERAGDAAEFGSEVAQRERSPER